MRGVLPDAVEERASGNFLRLPEGGRLPLAREWCTKPMRDFGPGGGGCEGPTRFHHITADVFDLHGTCALPAVFQAASQFNCLEHPSPRVDRTAGIRNYHKDLTQGPACALCTAPDTLVRNNAPPIDLAPALPQTNGYYELTPESAVEPPFDLSVGCLVDAPVAMTSRPEEYVEYDPDYDPEINKRGAKRARTSPDAAVDSPRRRVDQVYCAAACVMHGGDAADPGVAETGRFILDKMYMATLDHAVQRGIPNVYLTLLGGGAFGNPPEWIAGAIARAVFAYRDSKLVIRVVHYPRLDSTMIDLIQAEYRALVAKHTHYTPTIEAEVKDRTERLRALLTDAAARGEVTEWRPRRWRLNTPITNWRMWSRATELAATMPGHAAATAHTITIA